MKKKLGTLLAVLLTICTSVGVFADAGKTQQVDYKTDYYMIVESPDGGVDMYSEADISSTKLNDELIPNGTAIHVEGETKDDAGKIWVYAQLHNVFGFLEENYLKPVTLAEAVASELRLYGSQDVDYDIIVNAEEDGSVSLRKGPGYKYGTVSGGCKIANGEKLHINTEVDTGKDGIWGKTEAGGVSGWVNIAQATNTEESSVELIPDTEEGKAETGNTSLQGKTDKKKTETEAAGQASTTTPEKTVTPTPEVEETVTPTPKVEKTATPAPEAEKTATPTPEAEKTATPTPEVEETVTPTPEAEETVTPTPEATETVAPTKAAADESKATADNAGKEASSENVESTSNGMNSVIWILIVIIIIGIAVVIWLIKKHNKKSE